MDGYVHTALHRKEQDRDMHMYEARWYKREINAMRWERYGCEWMLNAELGIIDNRRVVYSMCCGMWWYVVCDT
jgi:hypothetical protein